MNQLKCVYNIPFLDSYSHPIHTCLSMIANTVVMLKLSLFTVDFVLHHCEHICMYADSAELLQMYAVSVPFELILNCP